MSDAYAAVDRAWRFTSVNAAFERMAGRGRETLAGKVCWDEFPALRQSRFQEQALQAAQDGLPVTLDEFVAGTGRRLEARLYPSDGGCEVYIRDVTLERRRAGSPGVDPAPEAPAAPPNGPRLADQLERAIRREEFFLLYQPQMAVSSGSSEPMRCAQVEALLRWRHPELGITMPDDFIPLAEETGLINPLGTWVLKEACRQGAAWKEQGRPVPVAVNVSPRQLDTEGFAGTVKDALEESSLPAGLLCLELTETALMRDMDAVIQELRALRTLGVRLAMDDFGTGYSCLAYLRRFPLTALKIDRAFVAECDRSGSDLAIVRAVIDLAGALSLEVVAEGIERAGQLDTLIGLGCRRFQGYLLHGPLTAAQVESLPLPETIA
jgi:EAL domain-containing protein (putative c-di-GMP-specific phosphodiesterase class I)